MMTRKVAKGLWTILRGFLPPRPPQHTVHCSLVPTVFREPAIFTGYRPMAHPWSYYVKSIFQIHNETFNIWSHVIAFFLFLLCLGSYGGHLEWRTDPTTWGFFAFGITACVYATVSVFGHTFHSRSEVSHYTCFQVDYIGTGTYCQGTGILAYYCLGCPSFYNSVFGTVFVPLNTLFGFTSCACCILAKLRYRRPYPFKRRLLQMSSGFLHSLLLTVPLVYRLWDCWRGVDCVPDAIPLHLCSMASMAAAMFFFSSNLPEKWYPGAVDIFGSGHQIFHVLVTLTTLIQFESAFRDITTIKKDTLLMANPDFMSVFGSVFIVILADLCFIYMVQGKTKRVVANNEVLDRLSMCKGQ